MPIEIQNKNKRIAKNTGFLYIRMLLVMVVTLYTSRIVLDVLGIEDYGLYNVIGGMISMLAFFTSSLSNATQRFLSVELGRGNETGAKQIFNQSLLLYIVIGVLTVLISECIGLWYIEHKMVIPQGRMDAAISVFHISIFTLFLGIIQVPYLSAIVAREHMNFYAYLGIFEVIAQLASVFLLQHIGYDRLVFYSLMLAIIQLLTLLSYMSYCIKHFVECSLSFYWDWVTVGEIGRFIGYNLFGGFAWSAGIMGSNLVLNLFFGPVINAARGIAAQVNAAVMRFTESIMTAFKPQIIKSYVQGDMNYMIQLIECSSKYSLWLMLMLSLPVFFNTPYILDLWLKEVPDYTVIFIRLLLVEGVMSVLIPPLWIAANATGKIKAQQLYGRMFTLIALPASYLLLRFDVFTSPTVVFWVFIVTRFGYLAYCFYDIHRQIGITLGYYFRQVILPGIKVLIVSALLLSLGSYFLSYGIARLLIMSVTTVFSTLIVAYVWGMNHTERMYVHKFIHNRNHLFLILFDRIKYND